MAGGGKRGDGRRAATTDAQWRKRRRTEDWSEEPAQAGRRGRGPPSDKTRRGEAGVAAEPNPTPPERDAQPCPTAAGPSHTAPETGAEAFFSAEAAGTVGDLGGGVGTDRN